MIDEKLKLDEDSSYVFTRIVGDKVFKFYTSGKFLIKMLEQGDISLPELLEIISPSSGSR